MKILIKESFKVYQKYRLENRISSVHCRKQNQTYVALLISLSKIILSRACLKFSVYNTLEQCFFFLVCKTFLENNAVYLINIFEQNVIFTSRICTMCTNSKRNRKFRWMSSLVKDNALCYN